MANPDSRGDLLAARDLLQHRFSASGNTDERTALEAAINRLSGWLYELNHAPLPATTSIEARAASELRKVAASACLRGDRSFADDVGHLIDQLDDGE